jgi:hypothetical protein
VTEYSAAKLKRGQLKTVLKVKCQNYKFFSYYAQKVVVLKSKALINFKIIDWTFFHQRLKFGLDWLTISVRSWQH